MNTPLAGSVSSVVQCSEVTRSVCVWGGVCQQGGGPQEIWQMIDYVVDNLKH